MAAGDLIAASITAKTLTDLETQAALKDEANVFTAASRSARATSRGWCWSTPPQPADRAHVRIMNSVQQVCRSRAFNDAQATVLAHAADPAPDGRCAWCGRNLYERGRVIPLGHYTDVEPRRLFRGRWRDWRDRHGAFCGRWGKPCSGVSSVPRTPCPRRRRTCTSPSRPGIPAITGDGGYRA